MLFPRVLSFPRGGQGARYSRRRNISVAHGRNIVIQQTYSASIQRATLIFTWEYRKSDLSALRPRRNYSLSRTIKRARISKFYSKTGCLNPLNVWLLRIMQVCVNRWDYCSFTSHGIQSRRRLPIKLPPSLLATFLVKKWTLCIFFLIDLIRHRYRLLVLIFNIKYLCN